MKVDCSYFSYPSTGFFSKIVTDYLNASEQLQPFYRHPVSVDGFKSAIAARKQFKQNRQLLVDVLKEQYSTVELNEKVQSNIASLADENTFTVTTAHQPNIFTGPLYFIYKILHAIQLAKTLEKQLPEYRFVPVYYMGSEDADLDELGTTFIQGEAYQWQTKQTGAVGRMKVDKAFTALLNKLEGQIGVLPHGSSFTALLRSAYTEGTSIQESTLRLVNALFGEYGLVIINPDHHQLKSLFIPAVQKELQEQFSHKAVQTTVQELEKYYTIQAAGRELNLFYLVDDKRERIVLENERFTVATLKLTWSLDEILAEAATHPERFSANVILRAAYQETILPNIAFIGGGAELAYWLELKQVFEDLSVPYPVLLLRNSFLLMNNQQFEQFRSFGFSEQDLFLDEMSLVNKYIHTVASSLLNIDSLVEKLHQEYNDIIAKAAAVDVTLGEHTAALKHTALKKIKALQKKMLRAEKRKQDATVRKISKIKSALFPGKGLQERKENIASFYGQYGKQIIDIVLEKSLAAEQQFCVLRIQD